MGLSLGPSGLCAVLEDRHGSSPRAWRTALTAAPLDESGEWPALSAAFTALMREIGATTAEASLALLPPLAEVRAVALPPLGETDTHQLLLRNAPKYFVSARGPQVVASSPRVARDEAALRIAAAASVRLLTSVQDAARSAGLSIRAFVPAEAAWVAGSAGALSGAGASGKPTAGAASTGSHRHRASLLVLHARQAHLLTVEHDVLVGVRRFRVADVDAPRIADAVAALGAPLRVAGSGVGSDSTTFLSALHGAMHSAPNTPTTLLTGLATEADALAASGAALVRAPVLETESTRLSRGLHTRRLATRLCVAAAACVLLAGALQLWGVQRELTAVRAERAAIRPQLGTTLVGRTTVETAFRQVAALSAEQRSAPFWSSVLADLSRQLPPESYLTGFRGRADTVGIDGLAQSAARVFDAVERIPTLQDVRATSPVRRESTPEGVALERFQLSALLGRAPAAPAGTTTLGAGTP